MNARRAVRSTMSRSVPRPFGRGGDVEEDELVGALGGVALGELGRIALIDEIDEVGALDDAAVGDVEAGDDAAAEHQAARDATGPPDRDELDEVGEQPQAVARRCAPGGTGRRGARPRATRRGERPPCSVSRGRGRRRAAVWRAGVRVDEVEVGVGGDPVEQRVRPRPLDLVPADVRQRRGVLEPDRAARGRRRGSSRRPRRCPRTGAGARGRSRGTADRRASQARIGSTRPLRRRRAIAGAGRADARDDERVGAVERLAVAGDGRRRRRRVRAPGRC